MKEEKYKAKCPRHIRIADPAYLEKNGKEKKKHEAIDYRLPLKRTAPGMQWASIWPRNNLWTPV